jgi:DNA-binding response OmpR family regulator
MPSTVLIVEDDPTTIDFVRMYLRRDGHKVLTAADGEEGLRIARERKPDLVVLDLMLPKLDGVQVCRALREESDIPVIMLTARVDEEERLLGLNVGADDYVTKPFSPRELAARVRAVLRRTARVREDAGPEEISVGGLTVDVTRLVAHGDGTHARLTPTELRILRLLMGEPGRVFGREQIIGRVFGDEFEGFDRTVDTHVSNLRRKLEGDTASPKYIQTVYGAGYRFGDA